MYYLPGGNYQDRVAGNGAPDALEMLRLMLGKLYTHDMLQNWIRFANFELESEKLQK